MKILAGIALVASVLSLGCDEKVDPVRSNGNSDSERDGSVEEITYSTHVKPIFDARCVGCHSSQLGGKDRNGAPPNMDFDTYEVAKANAQEGLDIIDSGFMPPGRALPDDERNLIQYWIDDGLQE